MTHSYSTIVAVANDGDLQQRFIAAAAAEQIPDPASWVHNNRWQIAAHDRAEGGLLDAYQYALDGTPAYTERKYGKDPGIINDGMILSVVQALKPVPPVE